MSNPGMNMQAEAASALQRPPMPQQGQPAPPNGAQGPQGGGIGAFMQAFARCEQTKQCTPQDRAVLAQGLPNLLQIAKQVQMILQSGQQQGAQPQPPAGP